MEMKLTNEQFDALLDVMFNIRAEHIYEYPNKYTDKARALLVQDESVSKPDTTIQDKLNSLTVYDNKENRMSLYDKNTHFLVPFEWGDEQKEPIKDAYLTSIDIDTSIADYICEIIIKVFANKD